MSVFNLYWMKNSNYLFNSNMNFVPGEIALLSKRLGASLPSANSFSFSICESLALLNLRALCWFILALGATPSTAKKRSYLGLTVCTISSIAFIMLAHTSSNSVSLLTRSCSLESFPWMQLCTIPFRSRYKLSKESK